MNYTTESLTTEEVCGKLALAGVDEATIGKVFSARLEPSNLTDRDRKFVLGIPAPDALAYLVLYRFGKAVGAEEDHWKPQWLSVEGPFSMTEVEDKARELTA